MEGEFDRRQHWEHIYQTKRPEEVSWYQSAPGISLDLIRETRLPLSARILDVGGGDSLLADHLLDQGYRNISVLDISEAALERARLRLGERAGLVKWIRADIANHVAEDKYDLWHDRAAFHFLTDEKEIAAYVRSATDSLNEDGVLIIGAFSDQGPLKCSGIEIRQHTEESLKKLFRLSFKQIKCCRVDHQTPFGTVQNFVFCTFRKLKNGEKSLS